MHSITLRRWRTLLHRAGCGRTDSTSSVLCVTGSGCVHKAASSGHTANSGLCGMATAEGIRESTYGLRTVPGSASTDERCLCRAESMFRQSLAVEPQDRTYLQLAAVYTLQGKLEESISTYTTALAQSPNNPELLTQLGLLYLRTSTPVCNLSLRAWSLLPWGLMFLAGLTSAGTVAACACAEAQTLATSRAVATCHLPDCRVSKHSSQSSDFLLACPPIRAAAPGAPVEPAIRRPVGTHVY